MKKRTLIKRGITGSFVGFILIVGSLLNSLTFLITFLTVIILGMYEFYKLGKNQDIVLPKYFGIFIGMTLFICNYLFSRNLVPIQIFIILIPLLSSLFIVELYRSNERPFINISQAVFGIIYFAFPFSLFNYFVHSTDLNNNVIFNPEVLLGFFFITWASDTGAYIIGSTIGKRKLFERVSPKKTWEGSLGGGIFSILVALILSNFYQDINLFDWIIISIITVVMGTYGDLLESAYKRSLGVKDSGRILPGHGGILDRFDSMLLAAPIVFLYLEINKLF